MKNKHLTLKRVQEIWEETCLNLKEIGEEILNEQYPNLPLDPLNFAKDIILINIDVFEKEFEKELKKISETR